MTVTPCRTCHLSADCQIRREKIKSVRGLRLTAIKFRCELPRESLQPGQRVQADLKYVTTGYYMDGGPITSPRTVDAVVMGWSREKVRIYVPYESSGEWWLSSIRRWHESGEPAEHVHVLRVFPNQLDLAEGRVTVCSNCGMPEGASVSGWECSTLDGCEYPEQAEGGAQ